MNPPGPPPILHDRYRLIKWLGRGTMGMVYLGSDQILERDVAVKFLPLTDAGDVEARQRFLREARLLARLAHPHIMSIYDAGDENGWLYLVLEFIPGTDLDQYRREQGGWLPTVLAARLVLQGLQALAHAHAQGITHRDIKPENLRLTPAGDLKVMDFGLSLAFGQARLTQPGGLVGTLLYLAPERWVLSPADTSAALQVDGRADLYSLGCVFYELLTGRLPFEAPDLAGLLGKVLNAPLLPPSAAAEPGLDIPAVVDHFVLRLLQRDPVQRFQSASQAADALAGILADLQRQPEPVSLPDTGGPLVASGQSGFTVGAEGKAAPVAAGGLEMLEAERRRLAGLLQRRLVEPLTLLLAQANAFENSLAAEPNARRAVAVLAMLARQAIQQAHDLEADLVPATLEALGLDVALEALASQAGRNYGLHYDLDLQRLAPRLPGRSELALYRFAQEALETLRSARAGRVTLRLADDENEARLELEASAALPGEPAPALSGLASVHWIDALGGRVEALVVRGGAAAWCWRACLPRPLSLALTPRELDVLRLAAEGLSNKEIARRLFVTPRTVNYHLDHVYAKLGVNSRTEAVVAALRLGLIENPQ